MSFTITTDVFCDKCPDWTPGESSNRINRRKALSLAKERGWTVRKKKHLCPMCNGSARLRLSDGSFIFKDGKRK